MHADGELLERPAHKRFASHVQTITPEEADSTRPHREAFGFSLNFAADALMVEVCFETGEFLAFDASSNPVIAYHPATILILYPTAIVEIEGRNLGRLGTYLKQRRIRYIQEAHSGEVGEHETYIDAIHLYDPADWERMVAELCPRMQKIKAG